MSKKKNTLSDLEEFLKIQASSLVTPATLVESNDHRSPQQPAANKGNERTEHITELEILSALQELARADKKSFYNFIVKVTKQLPNYSTEDALLINTALYLKGGSRWKEEVTNYWKENR